MRVVICDDHRLLAECLREAFVGAGHEVLAVSESPDEVRHQVDRHRPDALLLDLGFPDGDSLTAARQLIVAYPGMAVVVLTGSDSLEDARRALSAGVMGYLRKDEPVGRIIEAVQRCTAGTQVVDEPTLRRLASSRQRAPERDALPLLTVRESEVATLMEAGLNTAEIVAHLGIRESTVRRHVQAIFAKLAVHSRIEAVATLSGRASELSGAGR